MPKHFWIHFVQIEIIWLIISSLLTINISILFPSYLCFDYCKRDDLGVNYTSSKIAFFSFLLVAEISFRATINQVGGGGSHKLTPIFLPLVCVCVCGCVCVCVWCSPRCGCWFICSPLPGDKSLMTLRLSDPPLLLHQCSPCCPSDH